jgi:hypothetical protein
MSTDLTLACDGCGVRTWDRADMLEASFPQIAVEMAPGITITPLTLGWVGPCCAELANRWQPGDPEEEP